MYYCISNCLRDLGKCKIVFGPLHKKREIVIVVPSDV